MVPVPWSYVNSWRCTGCGICCREFEVVLRFHEWLKLVQTYGVGVTGAGLSKFYVAKRPDGFCLFSTAYSGVKLCGLQSMKPLACKIWPFKIVDKPKYGSAREALFEYKGRRLFVYVDPFCPEIRWGKPTPEMTYYVVPEFIEIALGLREKQVYSTSTMLYDLYPKTRGEHRLV